MMKPILITNARVWDGDDFRTGEILVSEGKIAAVGSAVGATDCDVIDAGGLWCVPGFVDVHVHLREPGYSYKETIASGTAAAAAGGFTTVCAMPNVNPVPDSVVNLERQLEIIRCDALVEVLPYASITRMRMGGECVDYEALKARCCGFSDDGTGVQDEEVMRRAMKGIAAAGSLLAAHCEVDSLLRGGYIHDGEYCRRNGHRGICSESEWGEVARDIRLAEETGCRLHICHVSTKESVQLIREAKSRGVKVTAETGPHYFAFCDEDMQEEGRFKMNPPLRSREDMEALRQGAADGTIDVVATDHAPHSAEEKSRGLEKSAMGVVGLETAFGAMNTYMVEPGRITRKRLVEMMCETPRRIFGIEGGLRPGDRADIAIVDFDREWRVDPAVFESKGKATPFAGTTLRGMVMMTMAAGNVVMQRFDK